MPELPWVELVPRILVCAMPKERLGGFLPSSSTCSEAKAWDFDPFGAGLSCPSDSRRGRNPEIRVDCFCINPVERQPQFSCFLFLKYVQLTVKKQKTKCTWPVTLSPTPYRDNKREELSNALLLRSNRLHLVDDLWVKNKEIFSLQNNSR